MTRVTAVDLTREPAHHTVTIRATIDFTNEYDAFCADAFARTLELLKEKKVLPSGGPMACIHNTDLDRLDVEAGWRVTRPVASDGDIVCTAIPSRTCVTAIDRGPYEDQDHTLMDILDWTEEKVLVPEGPVIYVYLNEMDVPAAEYLTMMFLPLMEQPTDGRIWDRPQRAASSPRWPVAPVRRLPTHEDGEMEPWLKSA